MREADKDIWKIALEDARYRHNAILQLIYAADGQALALLRLFLTISLGALAAAASRVDFAKAPFDPLVWFLVTVALVLALASFFCMRSLAPSDINLPGRGAEFWLWAISHPEGSLELSVTHYLQTLKDKHELNNAVNLKQYRMLRLAKLGGTLSPVAGLIAVGLCIAIKAAVSGHLAA